MVERTEIKTLDEAVERLYALNLGVVGRGPDRHERPHKPALLLAALDLIALGQATPGRIEWGRPLRERFTAYFDIVRSRDDENTPANPFFHLGGDGIWEALDCSAHPAIPLNRTPLVADFGKVHARLARGFERFAVTSRDRLWLRQALVSRYFPEARPLLERLFQENHSGISAPPPAAARTAEEAVEIRRARQSGFRRKILEIYDCQCAACGLRILLQGDLTFVDAAHLIPHSDPERGGDDRPTNGIALCKNHHWAMDQFLIAPTPEGVWRVASVLLPHRSPGEAHLLSLRGQKVLPPREPAYSPASEGLRWRCERLRT